MARAAAQRQTLAQRTEEVRAALAEQNAAREHEARFWLHVTEVEAQLLSEGSVPIQVQAMAKLLLEPWDA